MERAVPIGTSTPRGTCSHALGKVDGDRYRVVYGGLHVDPIGGAALPNHHIGELTITTMNESGWLPQAVMR